MKAFYRFINSLFLPRIDEDYVSSKLYEIESKYGMSIGETSIVFRNFDAFAEPQYPLLNSDSTENRIRYNDIVMIIEGTSRYRIILWNGFEYFLEKDNIMINVINTYRKIENIPYWVIKKPVSSTEILRNMNEL